MYELYTDASVSGNSAVATCFFLSTNNYLGYESFQYKNISSSLHGELLGIRDGIRYAKKIGISEKEIMYVYSDSSSAIQLIKSSDGDKKPKQFKRLVDEILQEVKGYHVVFRLIQGHQLSHNPNKVVDLTSNTVLRYLSNNKN